MLSIIIIALVIVFLVGMFKELSPKEREITAKWGKNYLVLTLVYLWIGIKALFQIVWYTGSISGSKLSLEGQEQLKSMAATNKEFASKGGPVKMAITAAKSHAETMQVTGIVNSLKQQAAEESEKLKKARAELASI